MDDKVTILDLLLGANLNVAKITLAYQSLMKGENRPTSADIKRMIQTLDRATEKVVDDLERIGKRDLTSNTTAPL